MKLNKVLAFTLVAVLLLTTLTACGHEHTFSEDWQKDATHHWHAASCEHDEEIDGYAEHEWNQGQVTTQPTCEDEGVKTFTCTVCGQTKTESIAVTSEHTFASEWSFDDDNHWHAATCEHDEEVSALAEHDWDEGEITTPATATEDGVMTYTCTVCGHSYTEAIPATGGGEQGGGEQGGGSLAAPIRIEAENATLGQIDGASNPIQIEENAGCSGGRGVGYFATSGQTITFTIVVDEAVNGVTLVLGVAPAVGDWTTCEIASMSAAQLATYASFALNGTAITFAGDTLPGNAEMNYWLVGTFTATVNLQAGTNTFVITSRGTALNVDYVEVR